MEDQFVLIALICFGVALLLFVLELFIPSGGMLGVASVVATLVGLVFLFKEDQVLGLVGTTVVLIAFPVLLGLALKLYPDTIVGRMMTLRESQKALPFHAFTREDDARHREGGEGSEKDDELVNGVTTSTVASGLRELVVGQVGRAESQLRPIGTCDFGGKRVECMSSSGFVDRGQAVRIARIRGNEVRVVAVKAESRA